MRDIAYSVLTSATNELHRQEWQQIAAAFLVRWFLRLCPTARCVHASLVVNFDCPEMRQQRAGAKRISWRLAGSTTYRLNGRTSPSVACTTIPCCPNSTSSICCGLVGQQVVQQAVQHLVQLSRICWRLVIFCGLVCTTSCGFAVQLDVQLYNQSTTISKQVKPSLMAKYCPRVSCGPKDAQKFMWPWPLTYDLDIQLSICC